MASISPLLIISLIVVAIVALVLIVLVVQSRRTSITTTSTTSTATCSGPPNPPGSVTITNPSADILTVSWFPSTGSTRYTAYLGDSAGFDPSEAIQSRVTTATSVSFGNLALGVTYYAKVKATNGCGDSGLSNEASYTLVYKFPTRFILSTDQSPTHHACDAHDSLFAPNNRVYVSQFCNNTNQLMFPNTSDNTIRQSSRPSYCLTRFPGSPNIVQFQPCVFPTQSSQQWTYNTADKSFCSFVNPTTDCMLLTPGFNGTSNTGTVTWGPKSTPPLTAWEINEV